MLLLLLQLTMEKILTGAPLFSDCVVIICVQQGGSYGMHPVSHFTEALVCQCVCIVLL